MPGPTEWMDDDRSRFGHDTNTTPAVETKPPDATWICEAIKKMYVDIRYKNWKYDVKNFSKPLQECIDMLYEDERVFKLRQQSDNYAAVMARVHECLKKAYTACQTERRVYVNVPYEAYDNFVNIFRLCAQYVNDKERTQYVKTTRDLYVGRQARERPIFDVETKLEDMTFERDTYKFYYETEREKREELQEQLSGQNFAWRDRRDDDIEYENTIKDLQEEVARLKAEIENLKRDGVNESATPKKVLDVNKKPRGIWRIFGRSPSHTSENSMDLSLAELKELTLL